jgi:hypothetical protein
MTEHKKRPDSGTSFEFGFNETKNAQDENLDRKTHTMLKVAVTVRDMVDMMALI